MPKWSKCPLCGGAAKDKGSYIRCTSSECGWHLNGEPTKEGLLRWPPDGYYDGVPCTCLHYCSDPCVGGDSLPCKCEACHISYLEAELVREG